MKEQAIPSASRLMQSLRGLGYDFATAVADLIDNSLEAKATEVHIRFVLDGNNSKVVIADNGMGIPEGGMLEVMRYGTEREYDRNTDLGKFGLGLKTASLSQCRRLEVVSRHGSHGAGMHGMAWDLDAVMATNRWEVQRLAGDDVDVDARRLLGKSSGTVVVWRKLDTILGNNPVGKRAENALLSIQRNLEEHICMVFHRFISGEGGRKIKIFYQGLQLEAWDPFARSESHTQILESVEIGLRAGNVRMEPFILPNQSKFSSREACKVAGGPSKWNQQQGLYIYRAGRMIQSGGWCRLRAADEHTKLARIAMHFPPFLDDAFKINVAKMRVALPAEIRGEIKEVAAHVANLARKAYDGKRKPKNPVPPPSPKPGPTPVPPPSPTARRWTLDELESALVGVARDGEIPVIRRVLQRLRR